MDYKQLIKLADDAKKNAYAPYSKFPVGAALLGKSGKVYTGVNVESATYGATICAERVAVTKAVSEGEQDFEAIAIISNMDDYTSPCGICRQLMIEFGKDIKVICANNKQDYKVYTIEELLPIAFTGDDLKGCID